MILDGVKEKFEDQKEIGFYPNNSSFILCDYSKNNENNYVLREIIPLGNKIGKIKLDRKNLLLTDIEGNILLDFKNFHNCETAIEYVNENDILISKFITVRPNFVAKKLYNSLDHYHYGKELEKASTLFSVDKGKLENFELINDDSMLIETSKLFNSSYQLYSIKKKDYISPTFRKMESVPNTDDSIFKYTDVISSSLEIDNIKYSSKIIGFITSDGKFYNGVYSELTNKEIECELNSKPNFEEYYELKKMIQGKLNEKVVKESNKLVTKDFIIKKLENKAKNIVKK